MIVAHQVQRTVQAKRNSQQPAAARGGSTGQSRDCVREWALGPRNVLPVPVLDSASDWTLLLLVLLLVLQVKATRPSPLLAQAHSGLEAVQAKTPMPAPVRTAPGSAPKPSRPTEKTKRLLRRQRRRSE